MCLNNPLISVIIPVYNGAAFLTAAIETIRQQLYEPLEIIIIDDGSTDNTGQIAADLGRDIRYIFQSNAGPAAARNTGLLLASGQVIAFLDVDDLWAQNRLCTQVECLTLHPAVDIVQGLIQDLELVSSPQIPSTFAPVSDPYYSINLGSAIYRRQVFDQVGLFDESLRYNEDMDWFIRAWDHHLNKKQLAEVALFYRKHEGNMTNQRNSKQAGFVWLLKKRLDQHRRNSRLPNQPSYQPPASQPVSLTEYLGWRK
ncbi:MAG: glycosyltransferase family 2 protein [Anaerolineales bacterium]|nr:glycosyltransferase family 2 protein [Anaerolineales bacterium]